MKLSGKAAIVTGATKGIGRAIAEALVDAGANVAVSARTEADVERVAGELQERGSGRAVGIVCDVRRATECRRLVEGAAEELGGLDILINNAGVGGHAMVEEMEPEQWDTIIETNLNGLFYCTHAALPHLKRAGESWVINIGSLAGKNAFPGGAAYNASKAGLIMFSEALMQEVRHDGVRVSYVMPGSVDTAFSSRDKSGWAILPEDIGKIVLDLLATPARTLPSRVEVRPSRPPRKG